MAAHRIGILGLGYVGLPLAVAFGQRFDTVGFDIDADRIDDLRSHRDRTLEVGTHELKAAPRLAFTTNIEDLRRCNIYIITVPTPVDRHNRPDLRPVESACHTVGRVLKRGDIVIFESTVYPGCTEDFAAPILAETSGLTYNTHFFCGYSPERINPGDKQHRLTTIKKVTAGSTPEVATVVDKLYKAIITAGTFKASSIAVAEAAKVFENTQRDMNIAIINELALICDRLRLDTEEVLTAAGTKWNFLPFRPGLVGGHCIGVDPYYLTHKAQELGYHPDVILAGRRLNDSMARVVAERVTRLMASKRVHVAGSRVLMLGLTFKEDCPDIRNSKVFDVIAELQKQGAHVDAYDPWVDKAEVERASGVRPLSRLPKGQFDAIVVAVAHRQFKKMGATALRRLGKRKHVIFDVKYVFPANQTDGRL